MTRRPATASWNLRDTLSLWTGGLINNQAQFDARQRRFEESLGSSEIVVGAAPNPAMLVDGVINLLHEMGYGEQVDSVIHFIDPPPPEELRFGMAPPLPEPTHRLLTP